MIDRAITNPLVSVIIPTYNCDRYIIEAIESVLNQTYSNKEIIIVDDGSTDNTKQVIKPYLNQINYFYQKNQGSSVARNRGIQEVKGEFIAFLDADDFFLHKSKLADQIDCFTAQPSLGIVHTGWQRIDSNGDKIVDRKPWLETPILDLETWLIYNPILPSAMMFRTEWLKKVGGFDPQFRISHDTYLIIQLALMGCETAWLKKITVGYRQHEYNLTNQTLKLYKSLPKMIDKFFNLPNIPNSILKLKDQVYYSKYVWLAWRFYAARDFEHMAECLHKSLACSPYPLTSNATIWLENFDSISKEEGKQFISSNLVQLPEWQQLIKNILSEVLAEKKKGNNFTKIVT